MRKILYFSVLFLLGMVKSLSAQHIVWEKTFGFWGPDVLTGICPFEGGYLAVGTSYTLGGYITGYRGAIIMKLDENGDTIFIKRLNLTGRTTPFIAHKFGDIYRTVVDARIPIGSSGSLTYPAVVEFSGNGDILQTKILTNYQDWQVNTAFQTEDYGLILGGTFNGGLTQQTQMMAIKVNFLGEVEWANKWFPPAPVRGNGDKLEQTKKNEYLLSGTLGRRIGGFTFDSAGNQLDTKVFYDTPSQYQFFLGGATQSKDRSVLAAGYYFNASNQVIGFFGKKDSLNQLVWGGEQPGSFYPPITNTDGSCWLYAYRPSSPMVKFEKYDADSILLKAIPVFNLGDWASELNSFISTGNDQVIGVGFRDTQNLGTQFFITKIDSFGTPITKSKPILQPPDEYLPVEAFPNPASGALSFKNLNQNGILRFYNLMGELVLEKRIQPKDYIEIRSLKTGSYLWHISTIDKKVYTGKLLKQ